MKWKWVTCALLVLFAIAAQLPAQQSKSAHTIFDETKAKAASGDVEAQNNLGFLYQQGEGVVKDPVAAVKWYRKAAEAGCASAQFNLGLCYQFGDGVKKNEAEAIKWLRKAAEQNLVEAQFRLGLTYEVGGGVKKNMVEAAKWFRKAAEQNHPAAQFSLACRYDVGDGVAQDFVEAEKWFRKAAEQNHYGAQANLGHYYYLGRPMPKDYVQAYKWLLLATAQGHKAGKDIVFRLEQRMSQEQTAEGQKLAREFQLALSKPATTPASNKNQPEIIPVSGGTGFFISDDGYLISNNHVVEGANLVRLVTSAGLISAKVVKVDAANDLALLKAEGRFAPLPLSPSRGVKLGGTVATVGFPNIGLQGFAPKLAKGEIAALSGAGDDARYFQISVPVQPGNSGGALVDERGNVVGVVSAKLNASAALALSGTLPENVNYAVKSSYLLSFLESVPEVASKLKEPSTKEKKFEDAVKEAEQAAVLVLVY